MSRGRNHEKNQAEASGDCGPAYLHSNFSLAKSAAEGGANQSGNDWDVTSCDLLGMRS